MSAHVVHSGPAWTRLVTELPAGATVDTFVNVGGKRGLVIDLPYVGADGKSYGVVGTADLIRVDNNSEAFTDGDEYTDSAAGRRMWRTRPILWTLDITRLRRRSAATGGLTWRRTTVRSG